MRSLKISFFCFLLFAFSCKQKEKSIAKNFNFENNPQGGSIEVVLKDTLKLNEIQEIEIRVINTINSKIKTSLDDFKILEGCILFPTKKSISKLKNEFNRKCDSLVSQSKNIKDTISISFNYKPTILGENYLLAKLEEKYYLKTHKDSIRMITYSYSLEEKFIVVDPNAGNNQNSWTR